MICEQLASLGQRVSSRMIDGAGDDVATIIILPIMCSRG